MNNKKLMVNTTRKKNRSGPGTVVPEPARGSLSSH